jgi:O-antigen ligase
MEFLQKRAQIIVLSTIALMVLLIASPFYDTTNTPKYSILFIAAALGLSCLLNPKFGALEIKNWKSTLAPTIFIVVMLLLTLATDQKYIAFFGKYGRNNGWIQYLCFIILFLLTAFSFNALTVAKLLNLLIILGVITSTYGFLQYHGIDFMNYADTGLPVIATLGNSNFASAFIGLTVIALVWKISEIADLKFKVLYFGVLAFELFVTYISKSSQGIFIALLGIFLYLGLKYFTSNKKITITYFTSYISVLILGLIGLLQIGPLTKFVYQASTSYRGDYYRAAWQMFNSDKFTGIGIDRYGDNYRIFRDAEAAFRLGPSSVAYYAHNTFLQFLATGGIFLLLAYVFVIAMVLLAATKGIKKFTGKDRSIFAALFSIWVAYQGQALVSIDQVSIATLGWVLSGAIIALGFNSELIAARGQRQNTYINKRHNSFRISTMIPSLLAIVALILSLSWLAPVWKAEYNIKMASKLKGNLTDPGYVEKKKQYALNAVNAKPSEINYRILAADVLVEVNELELARQQLQIALDSDTKSYDSIIYTAQVYERAGVYDSAIKLRIAASKFDKYDTNNWLKLGNDLATVGDFESIKKMISLLVPIENKSNIVSELTKLLPKS